MYSKICKSKSVSQSQLERRVPHLFAITPKMEAMLEEALFQIELMTKRGHRRTTLSSLREGVAHSQHQQHNFARLRKRRHNKMLARDGVCVQRAQVFARGRGGVK